MSVDLTPYQEWQIKKYGNVLSETQVQEIEQEESNIKINEEWEAQLDKQWNY